jgi:glutamate synthase (NADPH/NADH) small chain
MGDVTGFLKHRRRLPDRRPVQQRLQDWNEVYQPFSEEALRVQAGRCMDCGIPFCNSGCPLGNLIPDWNDLVYRDHWHQAIERLHATNNFPEFTGRLCPAPCEAACVLGITEEPVTIKQVELEIIERAWREGWVAPLPPETKTGKAVSIVGSGPAGLAAAQQLTRAGHEVVVFERSGRIGGLLRYGIPEFKMEKRFLDRRLAQMEAEGTRFRTGIDVGADIGAAELMRQFDAVVLATGAAAWRDLPIPGRDLGGIYQAMEYLPLANRVQEGDIDEHPNSARGLDVVIIGGGDTGADCLGTVLRHGCSSVVQFEILPRPPDQRDPSTPWPTWPLLHRTSSAHEEGGERLYSISTTEFLGDERVESLRTVDVEMHIEDGKIRFIPIAGTEREFKADLVLLSLGFVGPERGSLVEDLGIELTGRGNVARNEAWMTNVAGVFAAGDMGRGQSLIVWAIAEGRSCAASVDRWLTGDTLLPEPITPTACPLS